MSWLDIGPLASLPARGARVVRLGSTSIAVFRTSADDVRALLDRCPHRGGPLSQGIVHGDRVTCPLHDWVIDLKSGQATGADEGCTPTFAVRVQDGRVSVEVPDALAAEAAGVARAVCAGGAASTNGTRSPRSAPDVCAFALFERA